MAESKFHYERITPEMRTVFRNNVIDSIVEGVSPKTKMSLENKFTKESNELTVINFNYTKTFDKLFWNEGDSKEFDISVGDSQIAHFTFKGVVHPHRTLERGDILFGISEPDMLTTTGPENFRN